MLRTLQEENRPATEAEKAVLAQWGSRGAQGVFQIFDESREEYAGDRSLRAADIGTLRQLENRVFSLLKLAADVEGRRQEALSRIEQAGKALAEPFKYADALKAAQAESGRIDKLMAEAAKSEEPAQLELAAETAPGWNICDACKERHSRNNQSPQSLQPPNSGPPNSAGSNKPSRPSTPIRVLGRQVWVHPNQARYS